MDYGLDDIDMAGIGVWKGCEVMISLTLIQKKKSRVMIEDMP